MKRAVFSFTTLASSLACVLAVSTVATAQVEDDLREGDRYFEDGDWKRAASAYDRAIRKYPSQVSAEAYGKRAAIFIISKDYKGGLAFVQSAKAQYPKSPEIGEQEALLLWEQGQRNEAIKVAETVVAAKPTAFSNQQLIGEYYASTNPQKASAAYQAYLASRPEELAAGDVLPRVRLGFALLATARTANSEAVAQTDYNRAVEQFELLQKKFGKRPNAQVNAENGLCAAYAGLGKHDQAITICERIISDPAKIDRGGAVWYNLATAYVGKKQNRKARSAALEFTKLRKNEARGFAILGDTYFAENAWADALEHYLRAEKLLRPGQTNDSVAISIRLGKTYRRLPGADNPTNPNLQLAIDKLAAGVAANPDSLELVTELGGAYLAARQDAKLATLTDQFIGNQVFGKYTPEGRAELFVLAGKAQFNQVKIKEARARFESAYGLRPNDLVIKRGLVDVINAEAFALLATDAKGAQTLVEQSLKIDPNSYTAYTNLAVLAIERNECNTAKQFLARLKDSTTDRLTYARLAGRAELCGKTPNETIAKEFFTIAEEQAKKAGANLTLAEIYAEWAPLTWDTDPVGAVEKLQYALNSTKPNAELQASVKRSLAIAMFKRGWKNMREGRATEAAADFASAGKDPGLLKGTEPLAMEFSLALANLDRGATTDATKAFKSLSGKGNQGAYLKPPYAAIGTQFFTAYANYRSGNPKLRQQSAAEFSRLQSQASGQFGARLRDLIASSWEFVAYDHLRAGRAGAAQKAIATAQQTTTTDADMKRRLTVNRAAINLSAAEIAALEALGGQPVEALINLGIIYDLQGKPREAYDTWMKAKAKGAQSRDLARWIESKKRIYGY